MGVDQDLVRRIRGLIALDPRVTEKKVFGGIAFLLDGRILVSARRTGSLLVQCGADAAAAAIATPGVTRMVMAGKESASFIDVEAEHLDTDDDLRRWIDLGERYLSRLPPKA
jgi:hypothetical protein